MAKHHSAPQGWTGIATERHTRTVLLHEALNDYLVYDVIVLVCAYATQQLLITVLEERKQEQKDPSVTTTVQAYDPATGRWQRVCDWPRPSGFDVAIATYALLGDQLHVFGCDAERRGLDFAVFKTHSILNIATGKATPLANGNSPPNFTHSSRAMVLNGRLYLFDGDGSLQRYGHHPSSWSKCAPSGHDWRELPKLAVCANFLFAIGNDGGNDTVQRYDPFCDTWTYCQPLPVGARESLAVAASEDTVYVCGGYEWRTDVWHKACQRYSVATNSWSPIASMNTISYDRTSAVWLDGRVFVWDDNLMESYNPATDKWTMVPGMPAQFLPAACAIAVVW